MKLALAGLLIVCTAAFGQRAGRFGGTVVVSPGAGFHSPFFQGQFGLPPLQPIPPLGGGRLPLRGGPFARDRFGRAGSALFSPLWWPGYYGEESYANAAEPTVIVVQAPPVAVQPVVPAPPPQPARPVVHEYHFSEEAAAPPAPEEQRAYVIALKNGSQDSAVALWVEGGILHYVNRDYDQRDVALSQIDRALTLKLNREQRLPLSLPPGRSRD